MNRLPLIINTTAKSSKARRILDWVGRNLTQFVVYGTDNVHEARDIAQMLANEGKELVVAAGGDGTINHVIQGLYGSETALGILPAGTMNVFARELKIPLRNWNGAFNVIRNGRTQEINLFLANGLPFLQMAGIGFDAKVIQSTSWELKKALGPMAYVMQACRLIGKKLPVLRVEFPDGSEEEGVCVLIGNGSLYGGTIKLFPGADNTDGLLDVLIFKKDRIELMRDTIRAISPGILQKLPAEIRQTPSLRISSDNSVPIELDGDFAGMTPVEFSLSKQPLKVKVRN